MQRTFTRITTWTVTHPTLSLLSALTLTLVLGTFAVRIRIDSDPRTIFMTEGPEKAFYRRHVETFGNDYTTFFVIIDTTQDGLERSLSYVEALGAALAAMPETKGIESITKTTIPVGADDELLLTPVFGPRSELSEDVDARLRRAQSTTATSGLISPSGDLTIIRVTLKDAYETAEAVRPVATATERLVAKTRQDVGFAGSVFLAGIPMMRVSAIYGIGSDLRTFGPMTLGIITVFLLLLFRKLTAAWMPLVVIGCTVAATFGLLGLSGQDLDPVTNVFPSVLMVIGVADCIHFLARLHEERRAGLGPREAAIQAGAHTGAACLLTSLTSALGFASLAYSDMRVLRNLGLLVAAGIMVGHVLFVLIAPAMAGRWMKGAIRPAPARPEPVEGSAEVNSADSPPRLQLARFVRWLLRPRVTKAVAMFGVLLALWCGYLCRNLRVDSFLSKVLPLQHQVAQGNRLLNERMGGMMPLEVNLLGPPEAFRQVDILKRLERLHARLTGMEVTRVLGLAPVLSELQRELGNATTAIPDTQPAISQLLLVAEDNEALGRLVNADYSQTRLALLLRDQGSRALLELSAQIEQASTEVFDGTSVRAQVTGAMLLAAQGYDNLVFELLVSLLSDLAVVFLLIALMFRSVRMAAASFLPNTLPLLLNLAWFGITDSYLEPAPAAVFVIAIGIAVDDTIHVLARYREELARGLSPNDAIVHAATHTSHAVITTSLVLSSGFLVLAFSDFPSNRTFGILGGCIVLTAMWCDVLFTPVMLALFRPDVRRSISRRRSREGAIRPLSAEASSADSPPRL